MGACLASVLATGAQARLDNSIVPSLYDGDSVVRAKPRSNQKYTSRSGRKQVRRSGRGTKDTSVRSRAVTTASRGGGGGGSSRGCLQAPALALLNKIEAQFGAVRLVSTCRPGAVVAGSGKPSKHRYGLAVDFDAGGRKGAIVNWLRANHHSGGTMTYANMSHIHVDIGPRFVSLGAGGRGRRSRS
jgi:hypothetical protein